MSKIRAFFTFTIFVVVTGNVVGADSLYVLQIGSGGSTVLSASAAAVIVKKLDASSLGLQASIPIPTANAGSTHALTVAGNTTTEGHLLLSGDGNYLTFGGYDAVPGTATVDQTDAATVNRVVGRIALSNNAVDTSTALTDAYNWAVTSPASTAASIRSVVSNDGNEFWLAGNAFIQPNDSSSAGVRYATLGASTSTAISPFPGGPSNTRVVDIFNGQLYVTSGSTSNLGVNSVGTGLPTTTGQTTTLTVATAVSGTGNASPYDFWFKNANTVYVADDRASATGDATQAAGGGIQKWTFDGSSWNLQYILGTGNNGARGLTGKVDGANADLWATDTAGRIIKIIDAGASSVFSVVAIPPTNTVYRGIAFVPGPAGIVGDYNSNGVVDAADYVVWRKAPGSFGGDPAGYNTWRSRFGSTSGSGSAFGAAAVPEPASVLLAVIAGAMLLGRRRAA